MTTVFTAVFGNYDTLPTPAPQTEDADWVCFTDSRRLLAEAEANSGLLARVRDALIHPTGWRIVWYDRKANEHPNRAAKLPKVNPTHFTDAPCSIWLDASFHVVSPRFVADAVSVMEAGPSGIAQFKHPWRQCLFSEASESMGLAKYAAEKDHIARQVEVYHLKGMPLDWGLWATGVVVRRHDRVVLDWGHDWWRQIDQYSYQDQISHPYVCWRQGLRPVDLPGDHFHNPWLAYAGSGRH